MYRNISEELLRWKGSPYRKTLLLRGARQVGKTYSAREFGKQFKHYVEINFEEDKNVHAFFESGLSTDELCRNLAAYTGIPIVDGKTLLFFDEIQSCIPAISALRFFYEKRPELHVIAAGSLLEFALSEIPSFGVGRIESLYMYPMSFNEFLLATGHADLLEIKAVASPNHPIQEALHKKLVESLRQFMLVGGMPEAVQVFIETNDFLAAQKVVENLTNNFYDDFAKYKKHAPVTHLREMFQAIVFQAGNKFVLSRAIPEIQHRKIKEALELLVLAGLAYKVYHTSANGIPLGAQIQTNKYKVVLFDTGIFQRLSGVQMATYLQAHNISGLNKGNIAEVFAALEIVKATPPSVRPELYYWHREKKGSSAEVDYIIAQNGNILPIEVKSGTQGKMQSLFRFLDEKQQPYGIRLSMENFSTYDNIQVYPLYAVAEMVKEKQQLV